MLGDCPCDNSISVKVRNVGTGRFVPCENRPPGRSFGTSWVAETFPPNLEVLVEGENWTYAYRTFVIRTRYGTGTGARRI